MNVVLDYAPTDKQMLLHQSVADEVLYGGAAGGGKSYAICWDAFLRCMHYDGTHAYLFRRTYPELEMTLVRTIQRIVPVSWAATTRARTRCASSTAASLTSAI